jgi:hypothetical protein
MDCPFQLNTDGLWQCPQCKWVYKLKADKPPRRNCPKAPNLRPAAEKLGIEWKDVEHYAQALARWRAAGYPVRTEEETAICFRICGGGCGTGGCQKPCEHYRAGKIFDGGRCKLCRCGVSESRFALVNKIKMVTESCPDGRW